MAEVLLETDTFDVHIDPPQTLDVEIGDPMDKGSVITITKNGKHVVSEYDLAEVDVQPLPAQTKEVTITKNGTTEVTPDEGMLLDKVVVKADTAESVILDFLNNGGNFAYYSGPSIPKIDWSKLDKPNYDYFMHNCHCNWDDIQNFWNIYDDSKSFKDAQQSIYISEHKTDVFLTLPKGFKNTKKQNCILTILSNNNGLKTLTIDCNDLEYTGTLLGWSGNFRLKLLNTSKLKVFYNPTSNIELEAFDCSSLIKTPYNGVYNKTTYIGGFIDLGKGFLQNGTASNHLMYFNNEMQNLTKESLLNIFNGLYDLNLLGFTFVNQPTIKLGAKNFARLTDEDIKIATNKGWTVIQ